MGGQAIVERIISDAQAEAEEIIAEEKKKAADTVAKAAERAERNRQGTEAEVKVKTDGILDGKAATARLDCAKIALAEKRGVIDEVYARALGGLVGAGKAETLYLAGRLLNAYAEDGDEIIFADNFRYAQEVAKLDAVREKHLKISAKKADIDGGFILSGKNSDKNLSYGALLAADREVYQSEIAAEIFKD